MDDHPIFSWLTLARRAWLYRVILLVQPLIVSYGIANENDVALWTALIVGVLGTGTAVAHTPRD